MITNDIAAKAFCRSCVHVCIQYSSSSKRFSDYQLKLIQPFFFVFLIQSFFNEMQTNQIGFYLKVTNKTVTFVWKPIFSSFVFNFFFGYYISESLALNYGKFSKCFNWILYPDSLIIVILINLGFILIQSKYWIYTFIWNGHLLTLC